MKKPFGGGGVDSPSLPLGLDRVKSIKDGELFKAGMRGLNFAPPTSQGRLFCTASRKQRAVLTQTGVKVPLKQTFFLNL